MSSHAESADHRLVLPSGLLRPTRARRVGWLALVVLVAIGGIALYLHRLWAPPEPTYRTSLVERRNIARIVEATGQLEVEQRFDVPAPTPGTVAEILVKAGDTVARDQPLGTLDTTVADQAQREADAAARAAQSRVDAARTDFDAASGRREHLEDLYKDHFAKRLDVEAAHAGEERARSTLRQMEAEQKVASQRLHAATYAQQRMTLRAPSDGVVLDAPTWVGTVVSPDKGPLFVVGKSLRQMRVDVSAAEADIGAIRAGQSAEFTVPAFPGKTFHATVANVGVDSEKRGSIMVYPVTLRAENPEQTLRPGMSANVRVEVARVNDTVAVREAALRFTPKGEPKPRAEVWVSRNGIDLEPVAVNVGLSDGAYTQVTSSTGRGLAPGDPVVIGLLNPERAREKGPGISLGTK